MSASTPKPSPARTTRRRNVPTLADVAREAGVSDVAASCALNGGGGSTRVSAETRERVLTAAERLRYRPNATARALVHQRTHAIGFIASFYDYQPNLYFLEVFNGVVRGATDARQTTSIFPLRSWDEAPERIPALCDGRVDGLVVLSPHLEDDSTAWLPPHTPMVTVHGGKLLRGQVNIEADDEDGSCAMVRQMLALGHRRILYVAGTAGFKGADRRVEGYLRAHAEAGVQPAPDHVVRTTFNAEGGSQALEAWLQRHRGQPLPDVVFGGNDAIALGCMDVLTARGWRIPDDISVAGFDDTLSARLQRLATVAQPLHEMGRQAVMALMQLIEAQRRGETYPGPGNVVMPVKIVDGRTLARPRSQPLSIG
jgi:LacI family transcriptional regulator